MADRICSICGRELVHMPTGRYAKASFCLGGKFQIHEWRCPATPEQHRLAEAEARVEALEQRQRRAAALLVGEPVLEGSPWP